MTQKIPAMEIQVGSGHVPARHAVVLEREVHRRNFSVVESHLQLGRRAAPKDTAEMPQVFIELYVHEVAWLNILSSFLWMLIGAC